MKTLSSFFFWIGILSIPVSLSFWFMEPILDNTKLANISDVALRDAFNLASSQRLAIFVGLWPSTLLILSYIIDQRSAAIEQRGAVKEYVTKTMDPETEKISHNKKEKTKEPVEVF